MVTANETAGGNIGNKLRLRRTIKGLTLRETADLADISFGQLSQIERDVSSPSIGVLLKICDALQMPVAWLFDETSSSGHEAQVIVRAGDRRKLSFEGSKMDKVLFTPDQCTGIQMMEITIHPGGGLGLDTATRPSAKCGTVLEGVLAMEIEGNYYELSRGDAFALNPSTPHRYWCQGDTPVKLLFSISPALY